MKKKCLKVLSLILVLSLLLSVFTLAACGNGLDEVEKKILGTWVQPSNNSTYKFTDDRKFSVNGEQSLGGTFKHDGDGTSNGIYKYSVIVLTYNSGESKRIYYYESDNQMNTSASASGETFLYRL